HQESKLLNAGLKEDEIASLDSDWSSFTPAEQAAFKLAHTLTLNPHLLSDADIEQARKHYTDLQILEMVLSVAGNNSLNRWKEGVGVPQSSNGGANIGRGADNPEAKEHSYLTPTSDKFVKIITKVAPIADKASDNVSPTVLKRPALESRDEVE